jgi:hypothetical protein
MGRCVVAILLSPANAISTRTPTPRSTKFVSPVRLPLCDVAPLMPAPL